MWKAKYVSLQNVWILQKNFKWFYQFCVYVLKIRSIWWNIVAISTWFRSVKTVQKQKKKQDKIPFDVSKFQSTVVVDIMAARQTHFKRNHSKEIQVLLNRRLHSFVKQCSYFSHDLGHFEWQGLRRAWSWFRFRTYWESQVQKISTHLLESAPSRYQYLVFDLHTGAKPNFLSRNYQEFDVWKMWILWKMRL